MGSWDIDGSSSLRPTALVNLKCLWHLDNVNHSIFLCNKECHPRKGFLSPLESGKTIGMCWSRPGGGLSSQGHLKAPSPRPALPVWVPLNRQVRAGFPRVHLVTLASRRVCSRVTCKGAQGLVRRGSYQRALLNRYHHSGE